MADISAIFHWAPSAFDPLTLDELMDWRERAIDRGELLGLIKRK